MKKLIFVLIGTMLCSLVAYAMPVIKPCPPFRIAGNLYFVGNDFSATYLIVISQGNILINSDYEVNVPMIKSSVEKLGFKFDDTKILLISQAHPEHSGGSALIKKETGAKYMVMDGDVAVVESGGKKDFLYSQSEDPKFFYPITKVDRVLHDGDQVKLGDTVLVAHLTAGSTKGCTTWTMQVTENGKKYHVVIVGGLANPGYGFSSESLLYPAIEQDFKDTFKTLKSLPCDIVIC